MLEQLTLSGPWIAAQKNTEETLAATVPGDIYHDLLRAKRIDDPFYRDNELDVQWVGDVDWVYTRTIDVPETLLQRERVLLRCEGLDTICTIKINGKKVGQGDNMFRTYEFDVKRALRAGENTIEVTFIGSVKAAKQAVRTMGSQCPPGRDSRETPARNYLRKMQCQTGWDWGIKLPGVGIWRDMSLVGFDGARLVGTLVEQTHKKGKVSLAVTAEAETISSKKRTAEITVTMGSKIVAQATAPLQRGKANAELPIPNPKLWWPNGMGDQPLYQVTVELVDAAGETLDTTSERVGLRTIELVEEKDKWGGISFYFKVNGRAFFAKGANWIPGDAMFSRMTASDYDRLLTDAADVHMNMMRVWGGGIYEQDCFYDLCDEKGILVWQDFMFACVAYPIDSPEFIESVRLEAVDNVRRLRNRACIALWCGNNELEMAWFGHPSITEWTDRSMPWDLYTALFDKLLPKVLKQQGVTGPYIPSSPYSPGKHRAEPNQGNAGDSHRWDVWHGRKPFEYYRTCGHRFQSEYGFQAFPEPRTVNDYTLPEDRNVTSPIMEHHQRSAEGNSRIFGQMCDRFRMPNGFDNTLWLSQIQQAYAIQYAVDHFRRSIPRCMGSLYWQINDNWPIASWSSIDYHGRWKALHYLAKRFYAPLYLTILEDEDKGRTDIHLASDLAKPAKGKVVWSLVHVDGTVVASSSEPATIGADKSARVLRLELADVLKEVGQDNVVLFADFVQAGKVVTSNVATFGRIKRLAFTDPQIKSSVKDLKDGSFEITLSGKTPALFCWVQLKKTDYRCSDNFFHLEPTTKTQITLTPATCMTKAQLEKQLVVKSLRDTYK